VITQPEALRLAAHAEANSNFGDMKSIAAELRRLHDEVTELQSDLVEEVLLSNAMLEVKEELLAALKQGVNETLDYIKRNHLTGAENNHWIVQARAAIAKGEAK
jgi:hypothetical protein